MGLAVSCGFYDGDVTPGLLFLIGQHIGLTGQRADTYCALLVRSSKCIFRYWLSTSVRYIGHPHTLSLDLNL